MTMNVRSRNVRNILMTIALVGLFGIEVVMALEQQGPRIEIRELRHDLGRVPQGTQASHIFEVKSVGSEPLVIERVSST